MEMRVEIDPVAEGLNDGDNPRLEGRSGHGLKIKKNRSDSTAAKIPQELALELEKHPVSFSVDRDLVGSDVFPFEIQRLKS